MSVDETQSLELARRGDAATFAALVAAHRGAVFRFAQRLTGDDALAEDVLQETFLAAHQGLAGWRGEGSFRGWVLSIARRQVLMARRLRVGQPATYEPEATLAELGLEAGWGAPMDPEALAVRAESRDIIEQALAQLDEEDREVLVLRALDGRSGEETARVLGLSVAAMKSRLHRARLRLVAAVKGGPHGRQ
jgi:RNA polymerase sigma-70 factor (ECF subfamily)